MKKSISKSTTFYSFETRLLNSELKMKAFTRCSKTSLAIESEKSKFSNLSRFLVTNRSIWVRKHQSRWCWWQGLVTNFKLFVWMVANITLLIYGWVIRCLMLNLLKWNLFLVQLKPSTYQICHQHPKFCHLFLVANITMSPTSIS